MGSMGCLKGALGLCGVPSQASITVPKQGPFTRDSKLVNQNS